MQLMTGLMATLRSGDPMLRPEEAGVARNGQSGEDLSSFDEVMRQATLIEADSEAHVSLATRDAESQSSPDNPDPGTETSAQPDNAEDEAGMVPRASPDIRGETPENAALQGGQTPDAPVESRLEGSVAMKDAPARPTPILARPDMNNGRAAALSDGPPLNGPDGALHDNAAVSQGRADHAPLAPQHGAGLSVAEAEKVRSNPAYPAAPGRPVVQTAQPADSGRIPVGPVQKVETAPQTVIAPSSMTHAPQVLSAPPAGAQPTPMPTDGPSAILQTRTPQKHASDAKVIEDIPALPRGASQTRVSTPVQSSTRGAAQPLGQVVHPGQISPDVAPQGSTAPDMSVLGAAHSTSPKDRQTLPPAAPIALPPVATALVPPAPPLMTGAVAGGALPVAPVSDPVSRAVQDETFWVTDLRSTADSAPQSRTVPDQTLHRAELPRHVALQLADAAQRGPNRPVELTLSPAELGRVRINMQTGDGGIAVHIVADRPETLDLMRRNIEQLAQEFHQIGYGEAQFSFSQHGSGQAGAQADRTRPPEVSAALADPDVTAPETHTAVPQTGALRLTDRVDIRI